MLARSTASSAPVLLRVRALIPPQLGGLRFGFAPRLLDAGTAQHTSFHRFRGSCNMGI